MDQCLSRRAVGLAGAGAGIAALAGAAPSAGKRKKKTVVPPLVHASTPLIILEDATPDSAGRSGVRYRIIIGEGLHAVEITPDQQIVPANADALLRGAGGRGQQVFQITGMIIPQADTDDGRGAVFSGRFAGTFSVLSGVQDPETGVLTFEVDIIDFLTKVYPGPVAEDGEPRMAGDVLRIGDAVIIGMGLCC